MKSTIFMLRIEDYIISKYEQNSFQRPKFQTYRDAWGSTFYGEAQNINICTFEFSFSIYANRTLRS